MDSTPIIPVIIDRHAEDAAFLWLQWNEAVHEPHYDLKDLCDLDERLDANLDGLHVAGNGATQIISSQLEIGEPGEVFVAAWSAIDTLNKHRLDAALQYTKDHDENFKAVASAIAWHPIEHTQPLIGSLLKMNDPLYLRLGITACALHRIDPGKLLNGAIHHQDTKIAARAIRAAGELGRHDLLNDLINMQQSKDKDISFWAAWSAALLGDPTGHASLKQNILQNSPNALNALQLAAAVLPTDELKHLLQALAQDENTARLAMIGAGLSGDPHWIPGLLNQMENEALARICGEAFAMITGLDLAYLDLDQDQPEGFEAGPSDDPADENVQVDEDIDLPWPNPTLLSQWWHENSHKFFAGTRYLCGSPVSDHSCRETLVKGKQRQRNAAALQLAVMGHPYFETRAPGKRQNKLLQNQIAP